MESLQGPGAGVSKEGILISTLSIQTSLIQPSRTGNALACALAYMDLQTATALDLLFASTDYYYNFFYL